MQMVPEKRTPTVKDIQAGSPLTGKKRFDRNQASSNVQSTVEIVSQYIAKQHQAKRAIEIMYSSDSQDDQVHRKYEEAFADHERATQRKEEAEKDLIAAYETRGTKGAPGSPEKKGSDPVPKGRSGLDRITSTGKGSVATKEASSLIESQQRGTSSKESTRPIQYPNFSKSTDAMQRLNDALNTTPKVTEDPIPRPQAPKPMVLAGMTMLEKMEALKRAAPSTTTRFPRINLTTTTSSPTKHGQNSNPSPPDKYDPFAAMPAFALKPVTKETALHSNAPTDDERAFARALTRRNRIAKTKVELQSPSKAVFEEEGEWRPKTAPEAFGRGKTSGH